MTTAIFARKPHADDFECAIDPRRQYGKRRSPCLALAAAAILFALQACSTPTRLAAVPHEQ
jgi:hypothetical protein